MVDVISEYSLEQAIADGVLVEWQKDFVTGKPVVVTSHLYDNVQLADLYDLWDRFIIWREYYMPHLPEEDRMFVDIIINKMNHGDKVWVDETDTAITIMYPEDY